MIGIMNIDIFAERVRKIFTIKVPGSSLNLNPRPSIIIMNAVFSFPDKRTIHALLSQDEVATSTHGNTDIQMS